MSQSSKSHPDLGHSDPGKCAAAATELQNVTRQVNAGGLTASPTETSHDDRSESQVDFGDETRTLTQAEQSIETLFAKAQETIDPQRDAVRDVQEQQEKVERKLAVWNDAWRIACYGPDDSDWPSKVIKLGTALVAWDLANKLENEQVPLLSKQQSSQPFHEIALEVLRAGIRVDRKVLIKFQSQFSKTAAERESHDVVGEVFGELWEIRDWLYASYSPPVEQPRSSCDDPITLKEMASVCGIPLNTLNKIADKPEPIVKGKGSRASVFSYSHLHPIIVEKFPDRAGIISSISYAEARKKLEQRR